MLYNTAILIVKNEDDALDAVQDTILSCWEKIPTLKQNKYFKTWLTKILINNCYDILRQRNRCSFMEETPELSEEIDYDTPLAVKSTIRSLSVDDRLILSLFYYDDFSIKHISELLGISETAVKTRLSRSRNRFKKLYNYSNKEAECNE